MSVLQVQTGQLARNEGWVVRDTLEADGYNHESWVYALPSSQRMRITMRMKGRTQSWAIPAKMID